MTVQLTIVGLGFIGASIGLALQNHKNTILRFGHDREPASAQKAEKMGAVDRISYSLPDAVKEADVVILALPADQIKNTLEIIASELKQDAVVMDTTPVKTLALRWINEFPPQRWHYIGLALALNPAYLYHLEAGVSAARADLFQQGVAALVTPPGCPGGAIRLAVDLIQLLGSEHLFIDSVELDSLMAATHLLPQILAAVLIEQTTGRPGWLDARKLAGRAYAGVTAPVMYMDDPPALACAASESKEHVIRLIDNLLAALQELRAELQTGDELSLSDRFHQARAKRERWQQERLARDWLPPHPSSKAAIPGSSDWLGQFFGTKFFKKKTGRNNS